MIATKEELSKLTIPELKAALKDLSLPTTGKKDELIARYLEASAATDDLKEAAEIGQPDEELKEDEPHQAAVEAVEAEPEVPPVDTAPPSKHARIVFNGPAASNAPEKPSAAEPAPATKQPATAVADKLKARSERFKDADTEKAKARAERFNLTHPEIEKEKSEKRAERFGLNLPEKEEKEQVQKKAERAERFGIVDHKTKMELRKERFKAEESAAAGAAGASEGAAGAKGRGGRAKADERTKIAFDPPEDHEARKKARAERFAAQS